MNNTSPKVFHGIELLHYCGGGAYGEVYYGRDISGRELAVKIVSKQKLGDAWQRELKGVINYRKITENAPELLQIYHVEEDEDTFFYTMEAADSINSSEYVPDTLAARLKKGPLPTAELFPVLQEIFSGIKLIHEKGFAHRDIKPDNILFVKGKPKLGDIGLMSSLTTTMTQFAGTLIFVPPEQRLEPGNDRQSRQKNDLYAFGKVIYCVVTGSDPQDFPSIPVGLPQSLAVKLFLHFAFRLCDCDPVRRLNSVAEAADMFAEINRKLTYGETFRDRMLLFRKNLMLFFRVALQHGYENAKKHSLTITGFAAILGLTGFYAVRYFLSRADRETGKMIEEVKKQESKDLQFFPFENGYYSLDLQKEWQANGRKELMSVIKPEQRINFRSLQALIRIDKLGNVIFVSYVPRTKEEIFRMQEAELISYLSPFYSPGTVLQSIKKTTVHQGAMEALLAVGTLGADGTVISYLFPDEERTVAVTLQQKGASSDEERAKFIAAADSFAVHPEKKQPHSADPDGRTAFMMAVCDRSFTEAEQLLKDGADVNQTAYESKVTALHLAAMDDLPDVMKFLIEKGADVNLPDRNHLTPLHYAARAGFADAVKILLDHGAKTELRDQIDYTALCHAVYSSHTDCVKALLDSGADPNIRIGKELQTPLIMLAATQDDISVLELLIRHNINLNVTNTDSENALLRVLDIFLMQKKADKLKMADLLIRSGINVNQQNVRGLTPLMYAAFLGKEELVDLLLKHGAKKDIKSRSGRTAADYGRKYPEIQKKLNQL